MNYSISIDINVNHTEIARYLNVHIISTKAIKVQGLVHFDIADTPNMCAISVQSMKLNC